MSILEATHREPVRSVVGVHAGKVADEVEAARGSATNRTAPIVAAGTDIAERTIAVEASARRGQFKGRSYCTCRMVTAPT